MVTEPETVTQFKAWLLNEPETVAKFMVLAVAERETVAEFTAWAVAESGVHGRAVEVTTAGESLRRRAQRLRTVRLPQLPPSHSHCFRSSGQADLPSLFPIRGWVGQMPSPLSVAITIRASAEH